MTEPDGDPRDARATARAYYAALDDGDYDRLRSLLAPGFVQDRGDRTLEGREAFVRFVRDERPETATTHELRATYLARRRDVAAGERATTGTEGREETRTGAGTKTETETGVDEPDRTDAGDGANDADPDAPAEVAVRGLLRRPDGRPWFRFLDVFALDAEGRLASLLTFTRDPAPEDERGDA